MSTPATSYPRRQRLLAATIRARAPADSYERPRPPVMEVQRLLPLG